MLPDPILIVTFLPVLLFSLTFHEAAHAWMSNRLGDPTAKMLGRLTLNPLPHLDIFGTAMIFLSGFRFGWAKPVPVDLRNLNDPKRGMFLTAAAGPVSNIILAIVCGLLLRTMIAAWGNGVTQGFTGGMFRIVGMGVILNLGLAFFNLIPLPPLDGSKILMGLAPASWEAGLFQLERIGPPILLGIILMGFFVGFSPIWMFLSPFVRLFTLAFSGVPLHVLSSIIYS